MHLFKVTTRGVLIIATLTAGIVVAPQGIADEPLFETHELLELTLQAPLKQLNRKRDPTVRYPAQLAYQSADGEAIEIEAEVEVRGNYRRRKDVCRFPPLRILFDKERTEASVFEKQKKLKLVTQCEPGSKVFEQYVVNEYLAYRILNEITPRSFQVRLVRLRYRDVDRPRKSRSSLAFFIEHKKRMAKRLGAELLAIEQTSAVDLDSSHLNQTSLFQLMIGNVDWSATSGNSDECCHNYKLFEQAGNGILSIPYDFDLSGLVNAKYAKPDIKMGQRSVRHRLYRGYCRNNGYLEANIKLFNSKKPAILALYSESPYLTKRKKKSGVSYIESFYRIINDPKRVEHVILERCHKSYMVEVPESE